MTTGATGAAKVAYALKVRAVKGTNAVTSRAMLGSDSNTGDDELVA